MKLPKVFVVQWIPEVNRYRLHNHFTFAGQEYYPGENISKEFFNELKRIIEREDKNERKNI